MRDADVFRGHRLGLIELGLEHLPIIVIAIVVRWFAVICGIQADPCACATLAYSALHAVLSQNWL